MKEKNTQDYFSEAIKNIRDDRAVTSKLLIEVMSYIQGNDERHGQVGIVAAKYVETLQRSNEQLVKLVSLLEKNNSSIQGLTDEDKNEIFDMVKEVK